MLPGQVVMRPSDWLNFNEEQGYRLEGDGTYITNSIGLPTTGNVTGSE